MKTVTLTLWRGTVQPAPTPLISGRLWFHEITSDYTGLTSINLETFSVDPVNVDISAYTDTQYEGEWMPGYWYGGLQASDGYVYIIGTNGGGYDYLLKLDPDTRTVADVIQLTNTLYDDVAHPWLQLSASGEYIYAVCFDFAGPGEDYLSVHRIEVATGTVDYVDVSGYSYYVVYGPDGFVYDPVNEMLYVNCGTTTAPYLPKRAKINLSTMSLVGVTDTEHAPDYWAPSGVGFYLGGYVYQPGGYYSGQQAVVKKMDVSDDSYTFIAIDDPGTNGAVVYGVYDADSAHAYFLAGNGAVYKFDPTTDQVVSTISTGYTGSVQGGAWMVIRQGYLFVPVDDGTNPWRIGKIDLSTFTLTDTLTDASWDSGPPAGVSLSI